MSKRHHKSKNFKKQNNEFLDKVGAFDTNEPTEEDMKIIEEYCKLWWNGFIDPEDIKTIVFIFELIEDNAQKEEVVKPLYWKICKRCEDFKKDVSRALFTYTFILGAPYFKKWIKEENLSKKKVIKGELQTKILNILYAVKSINVNSIFEALELRYFEAEVKAMLTKMQTKEYVECLEINNKLFYKINGNIEFYEGVFYA